MKFTIQFPAPRDTQRYVYTEMARLGLSQEHLVSASVAQWDIFTTILVFELPDEEQVTQATVLHKGRPRYETENAARVVANEQRGDTAGT